MKLVLPWPPKELSPNARPHRMELARVKKRYRKACSNTALVQGAGPIEAASLSMRLVFVPPDRRARDVDNCVASLKAGLDGLADVLMVDDKHWHWSHPPVIAADEVGGFVRVEVLG